MKPKNVMLLGFVNKAIDYLDQNMDDPAMKDVAGLKDTDLRSLKAELNENIDTSVKQLQKNINTLLDAGGDAFDTFIESEDPDSLSSELDKLFNVDFDEEDNDDEKMVSDDLLDLSTPVQEEKEDDKPEADVQSLMEFYDLDQTTVEQEAVPEDDFFIVDEEKETEAAVDELKNDLAEAVEEATIDDLSGDATILPEETIDDQNTEEDDEVQIVLGDDEDFLDDEDLIEDTDEEETVFEMSDEESQLFDAIAQNVNMNDEKLVNGSDVLSVGHDRELDAIFNAVVENKTDEAESETEKLSEEEKKAEIERQIEEANREEVRDIVSDITSTGDPYYKTLDQLEVERDAREEKLAKELNYVFESGEDEESDSGGYVSSLIAELRDRMKVEDERKKYDDEKFNKINDRIHQLYPYLSNGFIRSVYEMKEDIAKEYPVNKKIILLHRVSFMDVENLRQFVEIGLNHNYMINADEEKLIVDIFKEYQNKDGKIISTIYEVANQAALLSGEYEGYNVLYAKNI